MHIPLPWTFTPPLSYALCHVHQGSSLNDLFHRHVVPAVKTALAAFYGEPIPAAEPNSSHSQSQHEAMAASQEAQQSVRRERATRKLALIAQSIKIAQK